MSVMITYESTASGYMTGMPTIMLTHTLCTVVLMQREWIWSFVASLYKIWI